jgi:hypothetical protein
MPAVIPIIIGLTAAGTAVSVVGQIKAGNAAAEAGRAQLSAGEAANDLELYNADVAQAMARDAIVRGHDEETHFRAGVRTLIGSQRAGFAGQNVDVGVGSPVDVNADAAYLGELDALTIRTNATREALGYRAEAERAVRRGEIDVKTGQYAAAAGESAQSGSRWAAAGTILGSAAQTTGLLATRYGWNKPK